MSGERERGLEEGRVYVRREGERVRRREGVCQ